MVQAQPSESLGSGLRILVIDDEPVICQFLELALDDWGFEVEVLDSAAAAITRFERRDFDLVLCDKNLADGNGLEVVTRLLQDGVDCKPMLMSGFANLASAVEAIRRGVADYFVKPLDVQDLEARLRKVIHLQRVERGNRQLIADLETRNAELAAMAVRDPLTHLFNHAYLQDALATEVARSKRHGRSFAFALIDLDRFNEVNDRHGHAVGDDILRKLAEIVSGRSRASDVPFRVTDQQLAARFGGDVFAVIMPETERAGAAARLERLRAHVAGSSFGLSNAVVQTMSVGLTAFPQDGEDREEILNAAQAALAAAKASGGDLIVSYTPKLAGSQDEAAQEQARRAQALGRSLAQRAFRIHYQPIVDCVSDGPFAYEALCRPTDEGFRHVGELFETTAQLGRLHDLGRILRPLAIEPMAQLEPPALLFINLHPQDLFDPHLLEPEPEFVPWASRVVFEVTETEAITNYGRVRESIARLREHGFRVALDDLGSGYASLNCLAQLEPDFVKLDMQLVRGIDLNSRAARLVKYLTDFCAGEGIPVIAEGIETVEELRVVRGLGIDLVQGYLFARPAEPFCSMQSVARLVG